MMDEIEQKLREMDINNTNRSCLSMDRLIQTTEEKHLRPQTANQ